MFNDVVYYNQEDYLETPSGNKLHRKTLVRGSDQIQLVGKVIMKQGLIIRADLAKVGMGKYVILHDNVTLKPSYVKHKLVMKFVSMSIGDYVQIEANSIVQASRIGSFVNIGKNCVISHRVLIGDNVIILDDSNVPPDTVIPSYCVYGGRPATCLQELPETSSLILKEKIFNVYKNFTPKKPEAK